VDNRLLINQTVRMLASSHYIVRVRYTYLAFRNYWYWALWPIFASSGLTQALVWAALFYLLQQYLYWRDPFTYGGFRKSAVLVYSPHLTSCIMTEYARGTNSSAVDLSITSYFNRLGAYPLPDNQAEDIRRGTIVIAKHLTIHAPFVVGGA